MMQHEAFTSQRQQFRGHTGLAALRAIKAPVLFYDELWQM